MVRAEGEKRESFLEVAYLQKEVRTCNQAQETTESKHKKPPFQYNLYQECGFLYLISHGTCLDLSALWAGIHAVESMPRRSSLCC
eukprot:3411810-Rhodomonas_salina.3